MQMMVIVIIPEANALRAARAALVGAMMAMAISTIQVSAKYARRGPTPQVEKLVKTVRLAQ